MRSLRVIPILDRWLGPMMVVSAPVSGIMLRVPDPLAWETATTTGGDVSRGARDPECTRRVLLELPEVVFAFLPGL